MAGLAITPPCLRQGALVELVERRLVLSEWRFGQALVAAKVRPGYRDIEYAREIESRLNSPVEPPALCERRLDHGCVSGGEKAPAITKKEEKAFVHNPGNLDRDQYTETGVCLFFDHFGTKVRPVL
ncbi:MAG: hypothetical protein OES26_22095 [Gammaproteobacteria bacterium]|nr:hypothetical protein [Gammaproteobacteria bacterium]